MRTIQDKYIAIYRELIAELHIYASAIRILAKGSLPNTSNNTSKTERDFKWSQEDNMSHQS